VRNIRVFRGLAISGFWDTARLSEVFGGLHLAWVDMDDFVPSMVDEDDVLGRAEATSNCKAKPQSIKERGDKVGDRGKAKDRREGGREGGGEGGREGGREGGMEGWREGGRERGREGERVFVRVCERGRKLMSWMR
jgi:hypothetical protein